MVELNRVLYPLVAFLVPPCRMRKKKSSQFYISDRGLMPVIHEVLKKLTSRKSTAQNTNCEEQGTKERVLKVITTN